MNGIPDKLYKYVPMERVDILRNLNIRFTQPSALNDPFEFNLLFTEIVSIQELRDQYTKIDINEVIKEELNKLPEYQRAILNAVPKDVLDSFLKTTMSSLFNSNRLDELHQNQIAPRTNELKNTISKTLNRLIGILSLSAEQFSPPMWASYADNSKGFVIEFDTSNEFFNRRRSESDEFYHLRKVIYEDRPSSGTMSETSGDIFIRKSLSWKYENEWRMLLPLDKAENKFTTPDGDDIFLFNYPPSAVSGIIFGLNTNEQTTSLIKETINKNEAFSHITFKRIVKGPTGFEVGPS